MEPGHVAGIEHRPDPVHKHFRQQKAPQHGWQAPPGAVCPHRKADAQAAPVSYTHLDLSHMNADGARAFSAAFASFLQRLAAGEDVSGLFYTPEQAKERL